MVFALHEDYQEWWKKEHILKMNKNTYKILQGTLKQAHQRSEKNKHMQTHAIFGKGIHIEFHSHSTCPMVH